MEVSRVIRGEKLLPSAPPHVLLCWALGWGDMMRAFARSLLLLKLEANGNVSKRDGDLLGFPVMPLQCKDLEIAELSSGFREGTF
jgi:glutamyl-tRNA synthetase